MVLGFFSGSTVIFAFRMSWLPIVTVTSSSLQTRFICLIIASGIGCPSAVPETRVHSPWRAAISFLAASLSAAKAPVTENKAMLSANQRVCVFITFGFVGGWDEERAQASET